MMRSYYLIACAFCALIAGELAGGVSLDRAWGSEPAGLSTCAGVVIRSGKPYRGIGVNFFDAFLRTMTTSTDTSYRDGFRVLSDHKIPYARISMCGFSPIDYKVYRNNRTEYFRRMDGVVHAAEQYNVGIIADLFWGITTCADISGEHMDAYDDPNSQTYAFMRQYIDDVVGRYKDSPAIWGWECGNEYNLFNDLSNGYSFLSTYTDLGYPATRDSVRDNFPCTRTNKLLSEFAKEVRRVDPSRIIVSGNAVPRGSAWHLTNGGSWTQDTKAQFGQVLRRDNPDPLDVICIHAYYDTSKDFFADQKVTYSGLMAAAKAAGAQVNKPIFVGECSAPSYLDSNNTQPNPNEHAQFNEIIAAFEDNKIPLAAVWTFGRWSGWGFGDPCYDIEDNNARGYMLDLIQQANDRISRQLINEQNGVKESWVIYR